MKTMTWFIASALLSWAATAHAHAHLSTSVPPDGSTGKAPEEIVLTFSARARITAMSLQRESEASRKLGPLPTAPAMRIAIPLPKLLPGRYTLSWRVVSDDAHVTPGALHFTVVESAAAAGSGGARDHGS